MAYYTLSLEEQKIFNAIDLEFDAFITKINTTSIENRAMIINTPTIKKAYQIAKYWHRDKKRKSGELYLYHPLAICKKMFFDGFVDANLLAAALLHDTVEDTDYTPEKLEEDFNKEVRTYVEIVTKLESSADNTDGLTKKQAQFLTDEHYIELGQKHPLALYIKFADRYHNLNTCSQMSEESIRRNVGHTRSVLIPLARKVGCNLIANQLEDACVLALYPEAYKSIVEQQQAFIASSRKHIVRTINEVVSHCEKQAMVDKEFLLPYPSTVLDEIKRMHPAQHINLSKRDAFACYEYKPYVEVVFNITSPNKKPLCSQFLSIIRDLLTRGRLDIVGEGCQYHPNAKNVSYVDVIDSYYNKIRFIISSSNSYRQYCNSITEHNFNKLYRGALLPSDKRVKILTRDGDPVEIEKGATVLDFAFILNSEIGSHYKGASVNGNPVEMDYVLQPGDHIVVFKSETVTARVSWFAILETKTAINRLIPIIEKMMIFSI